MVRRSRIGVVALAIVLLLLTACTQTKPPQNVPAPETEEEKELTLILPEYSFGGDLGSIIRSFERSHPHIRIRTTEFKENPFLDRGEANPAAFEGADMVYGSMVMATQAERAGLLLDLSALSTPAWDPSVADLVDAYANLGGKRAWLPLSLEPRVFKINLPTFQRLSISVPEPDWTWADFEQTLRGLVEAGEMPGNYFQVYVLRQQILHAFGGGDYDVVNGKWRFNTPENHQAYELLRRMVQDGLITVETGMPNLGSTPPPLTISSSRFPVEVGMKLIPFPVGPAGRRVDVNTSGLMILEHTQHREEAIAFAQFLLTPEAQQLLAAQKVRPLIQDDAVLQRWQGAMGDELADLVEVSLAGGYKIEQPQGEFIQDIRQMLLGQAGIGETLAALDERLNK